MKNLRREKAVTLIALVVIIIVLIILAGIGLNAAIGENGFVTRAVEAKEKQKIASIQDHLEMYKGEAFIKKQGPISNAEYVEYVHNKGEIEYKITDEEVKNEIETYITINDKYVFLLEKQVTGNIKIIYQGTAGKLLPRIRNISVSTTTNTITLLVDAPRAETYNYYIKENNEYKLVSSANTTSNTFTYERLTHGQTYEIKVEAINSNGKVEDIRGVVVKTMADLQRAETIFTVTPNCWTNENVNVTISLIGQEDTSNYQLQYLVTDRGATTEQLRNDEIWKNYSDEGIDLPSNKIIDTRLSDGYNKTSWSSVMIGNIDKTDIEITKEINNKNVTTKGFTLEVGAQDDESGFSKVEWYYKKSDESTYTQVIDEDKKVNSSTEGVRTLVAKEKMLEGLTSGTYNCYAIVYDVAGNNKRSETIDITLETVVAATSENLTAKVKSWDGLNATVELSTTTNFSIQYSIDVNGPWTTGNETTVETGTTVYARLYDNVNGGMYYEAITPILTYNVEFDGNENTSGNMVIQTGFEYGKAKQLAINTFGKNGYLFAGWNTKADGTGINYEDQASMTTELATNNGTLKLYAQWSTCNHTWNTGTVTTNATCTANGTKTFTCTKCNKIKTESIPALGHNWQAATTSVNNGVKTNATCTAAAVYYKKCSRCTTKDTNQYNSVGAALGHNWTSDNDINRYNEKGTMETDGKKSPMVFFKEYDASSFSYSTHDAAAKAAMAKINENTKYGLKLSTSSVYHSWTVNHFEDHVSGYNSKDGRTTHNWNSLYNNIRTSICSDKYDIYALIRVSKNSSDKWRYATCRIYVWERFCSRCKAKHP